MDTLYTSSLSLPFLRFCVAEAADVLLAPLSSSSLGSALISGLFSAVSDNSCFGSTVSGSSFFTKGGLASSSCYSERNTVTQLSWVHIHESINTQTHFLYRFENYLKKMQKYNTSIFISTCFFPTVFSSSFFTWGLASVLLMSGSACCELSSATEAGVGTLLSILAAAWDD